MDRERLVSALNESGLGDLGGFTIQIYHNMGLPAENVTEYWEVILVPTLERVHLIRPVFDIIDSLDIRVGVFTDKRYPGYLIIH